MTDTMRKSSFGDLNNTSRDDDGGTRAGPAETMRQMEPQPNGLGAVMMIPVTIEIVLGTARMPLAKLMQLGRGSVIPLDRRIGEPVDVVVNDRVIARGEVVVLDAERTRFGVSLTSIVSGGQQDTPET